jgi:uncharacterized protein (DUF433 family)
MTRFTLADLERAAAEWSCSCGPTALAAICNLTLDEVRPHFPGFRGWCNPTMMFEALASLRRATGRRWSKKIVAVGWPEPWPRYGLVRIQWEGPWTEPGANPRWAYRHTHWVGVSPLQPAAVSIDPDVSFGRSVLAGTRVKVAVVADLAAAGEPIDRIAREFDVAESKVRDAIAWHRGEGETCIWDVNAMDIGRGWSPLAWWSSQVVPRLTREISRATGGWHVTHAIEVSR